jgi:hypothetical protein
MERLGRDIWQSLLPLGGTATVGTRPSTLQTPSAAPTVKATLFKQLAQ